MGSGGSAGFRVVVVYTWHAATNVRVVVASFQAEFSRLFSLDDGTHGILTESVQNPRAAFVPPLPVSRRISKRISASSSGALPSGARPAAAAAHLSLPTTAQESTWSGRPLHDAGPGSLRDVFHEPPEEPAARRRASPSSRDDKITLSSGDVGAT